MKILATGSFFLALALVGLWVAHGMHLATLTEKPVETTSVDDFGDTVVTTTWQETLEVGLDVAIPGVIGFLLEGIGLFLLAGTSRKRIGLACVAAGGFALIGAAVSLVFAFA